ncbi:Spc98 family-domain-containing protein [Melampsora americana]|nr:Spc98 family-domain-containing protein [Melampsora americana]
MEYTIDTLPPLIPIDVDPFQTAINNNIIPKLSETINQNIEEHPTKPSSIQYYPLSPQTPSQAPILSWDTYQRKSTQSIPTYQSPYPIESSTRIWDVLLQSNSLNESNQDPSLPYQPAWPLSRASDLYARLCLGLHLGHSSLPRILGLTNEASQITFDFAYNLGLSLSKLDSTDPYKQGLLASGLDQLGAMLRVEINSTLAVPSHQLILTRQTVLGPILDLLSKLTDLIIDSAPSSPTDQLTHLYRFADHFLQTAGSPMLQVVSSWLLDRVSTRVLVGWETWLGMIRSSDGPVQDLGWLPSKTDEDVIHLDWPNEFDELHERLWRECGIERVQVPTAVEDVGTNNMSPDAIRFKTNMISYHVLKLDRIPTFMPIEVAEKLFEAGIALRILRMSSGSVLEKSGPRPVCRLLPIETRERARWVWSAMELEGSRVALAQQARDIHIRTSAWRNHVKLPSATPILASQVKREAVRDPDEPQADLDKFFEDITRGLRCDGHSPHCASLLTDLEDRLQNFKNHHTILQAMCIPSLSVLTHETVHNPLLARASSINQSLLSFFIIDMELLDHLQILGRFLFCFDVDFSQRLSKALFDQIEQDGLIDGAPAVGVSVRLMEKARWPPGGFDLSSALRSVVLDSIPDELTTSAWHELDDRLSFATEVTDQEHIQPADSIHAFDFLFLDFKPPSGLIPLLNPEIIEHYRDVNRYLMKLLRLQSIMRRNQHLLRARLRSPEAQRSEIHGLCLLTSACQRLLDGLVSFTWDIAIEVNWRKFMEEVNQTRLQILNHEQWPAKQEEEDTNIKGYKTVEELKEMHRLMIEDIRNALFLRDRQVSFMKIFETSIFQPIIGLGKILNGLEDEEEGAVIEKLKGRQIRGLRKLINALEALSDRAADREVRIRKEGKEGFLNELVSRLDWNRFYADHSV